MSKKKNTCVIYEKLRQSYEKLSDIILEKDKLILDISSEYEEMASISGPHDDFLKTIITKFDDVEEALTEQFTNIENINNTIKSALDSFSQSEEGLQVDKEKFISFIQDNSLIDDEEKEQLKSSSLTFYYTAEAFSNSLSASEKDILTKYKEKLEEYTNSLVSSSVIIDQEFDDGPVDQESDEKSSEEEETQYTTATSTKSAQTVYYRKSAAIVSSSVTSTAVSEASSNSKDLSTNKTNESYKEENINQTEASTNEDNNQTNTTTQQIKKENIDNTDEQNQKEEVKTNVEAQDDKQTSTSTTQGEEQQTQSSSSSNPLTPTTSSEASIKTTTLSKDLTTSLKESKQAEVLDTQELEENSLQTDEVPTTEENSYFPSISSNNTTSALDDMLAYSSTSSEVNTKTTKSSGIGPVAIGLGLAGTTSVAANKIIRKKQAKQSDKINEFENAHDNEERRFIPKDLPETEEDSSSEENPSSANQSEENDWYKYIKELY